MNERIREIIPKAYELQRERHGGHFTQELLLACMAELVIRGCTDVAEETALGDTTYGWMVANRIKQHFGVE